jgi:hypothetical protein
MIYLVVAFLVVFHYLLMPFLITALLTSFGVDISFWQALLAWCLFEIVIIFLKGGSDK